MTFAFPMIDLSLLKPGDAEVLKAAKKHLTVKGGKHYDVIRMSEYICNAVGIADNDYVTPVTKPKTPAQRIVLMIGLALQREVYGEHYTKWNVVEAHEEDVLYDFEMVANKNNEFDNDDIQRLRHEWVDLMIEQIEREVG